MRAMRTTSMFLVAIALLVISGCSSRSSDAVVSKSFSTPTGTGHLRKSDTLWILNTAGSYTDMGRQYGALLKDELGVLYTRMDAAIGFNNPEVTGMIAEIEKKMEPRESYLLNGMSLESGLTTTALESLNTSLFFMYAGVGCSAFAATGSQTKSHSTIAGRNFDNPRGEFSTLLRGNSILVIYNPKNQFTSNGAHQDNSVALMTQIGWLYGLTNLSSKGIYLEYNNATNSIPIIIKDANGNPDYNELMTRLATQMDGLHQNLYAAFDADSLEDLDSIMLDPAKLPAVANMTQVADNTRVWHYERSPFEVSKKILAGDSYGNPVDTDIFTNHFFYTDWQHQNSGSFTQSADSGSKTFNRLRYLQDLATQNSGTITPEKMKDIMTTHLPNDVMSSTGGPFIGWELSNPDVTHFTTVTDIANKVMHIYPYVDAILYVDTYSVKWATVDLNTEFR
jgi:hypothetical protein